MTLEPNHCKYCGKHFDYCDCQLCECCDELISPYDEIMFVRNLQQKKYCIIHDKCEQAWIDECNFEELMDMEERLYGDH